MIPTWKKYLSYITELHIESAPGKLNPHLYLSLYKGRLQLSTANAIYSFEDLYDNFAQLFAQTNWKIFTPEKILILGGGLLSINILLEKHLKHFQSTVIEYDENVIYLASKYVINKLKMPTQLIEAEAYNFVMSCQETFDLIIVDVFDDDRIPRDILSKNFLKKNAELLSPSGLLIYNRLAKTQQDKTLSLNFFTNKFISCFPNASYIDVTGNYMLINTKKYLL